MIVVKFGGTSVGDAAAIERATEIVRGRLPRRPLVVVSALAGTTNALLAIAEQSAKGQLIGALRGVETLRDRHLSETSVLLGDIGSGLEVATDLGAMFDELASLAEALSVLGHVTPRSLDAIAAIGERLSSQLVVAVLCARGVPAVLVDPAEVMITDDHFTRAEPQPELIGDAAQRVIRPLLASGVTPVVGGFVGATRAGVVTTLGRGGSDYSAALFGAALRAEAIEIWTDVDGMLTGDPRVVDGARLIEQIRFDEASELASFGAKVLHPSTIAPAVRIGIPVYIYNSRRPDACGTRITFDAPRRPVSAIAGKRDVSLIRIRTPRMLLAHGFLRRIFEIFDEHRTSVDVVATSEVSVSMTIDDATHLDALLGGLTALGDVSVERNRGIVALVGAGLGDSTATMARALAALGNVKVHMASLSSGGMNLTLLVDGDQVTDAMRRLHDAFFPPAHE
ncbi:MAG: aspartate kinase [Geminicoccaceae bacterium]|jgi:aspartate kinase|nr:aspartate kinase [Geminicoccaceae bacterium]